MRREGEVDSLYVLRASQFFITTEGAEDTENGHFMGNYGGLSVSSGILCAPPCFPLLKHLGGRKLF
jgi:hypothetical protein